MGTELACEPEERGDGRRLEPRHLGEVRSHLFAHRGRPRGTISFVTPAAAATQTALDLDCAAVGRCRVEQRRRAVGVVILSEIDLATCQEVRAHGAHSNAGDPVERSVDVAAPPEGEPARRADGVVTPRFADEVGVDERRRPRFAPVDVHVELERVAHGGGVRRRGDVGERCVVGGERRVDAARVDAAARARDYGRWERSRENGPQRAPHSSFVGAEHGTRE